MARKTKGLADSGGSAGADRARRKLTLEEFWVRSRDYPDKAGVMIYLYRLWPVIQRTPSYIDKAEAFNQTEILQRHGSGKYRFCFTDANKPQGFAEIFRCDFVLEDPEFPPAPDIPEVVVGHPDNRGYVEGLRLKGRLPNKEGEEMKEASGMGAVAELARDALTMVRDAKPAPDPDGTAMDRAIKLVQTFAPKNDPMDMAVKIAALSQGGGMSDLVKVLSESNARMMEALQKRPAAENPFGQIEQVTGLLEKLGVRVGAGGGGRSSGREWWEIIPETLNSLNSLAGTLGLLKSQSPEAAAALANRPALPATTEEGAMPGVVRPQRLLEIGQRALARFAQGVSGNDFAHGLCTMEDDGEQVYAVLSLVGVEQIMSTLRQAPQWSALAAREAELRAWLDDFMLYGQDDDARAEGGNNATV